MYLVLNNTEFSIAITNSPYVPSRYSDLEIMHNNPEYEIKRSFLPYFKSMDLDLNDISGKISVEEEQTEGGRVE